MNVNPAGWETSAIEQSALCHASLAHVQKTQRSASAMNVTLAKNAKRHFAVGNGNATTEVTVLIGTTAFVIQIIQDFTVRS